MLKVQLGVKDTLFLIPRNAHSFIKVRGSITVPSTSCKTGLDMAVVDINKNFCIIWLGQLFRRLTVRDPSPYFYKGVTLLIHITIRAKG